MPLLGASQGHLAPVGTQFSITASAPGDQVAPNAAINAAGGYAVWHDNNTDGSGLGIGARKINENLSGQFASFRVNEQSSGDQENAKVQLLKNGGAVFVWQGGEPGWQDIYARFMNPNGTFLTGDILLNEFSKDEQVNPSVAVLADGTVVVAWSSFGQDGSLAGVYARRLTASGAFLGAEFQVNSATLYNQRNPIVTALSSGGFAIVWLSERVVGSVFNRDENGSLVAGSGGTTHQVSVFGSIYNAAGDLVRGEFPISSTPVPAANPAVAADAAGGFAVMWGGLHKSATLIKTASASSDEWDILFRTFNATGNAAVPEVIVNSYRSGNQLAPKIAYAGGRFLGVWTSAGQEGFEQSIFGRLLNADGSLAGEEFRVNAITAGPQQYPSVASDGLGRYLVTWSGHVRGLVSYEVFAQRYAAEQPLLPAPTPFVSALSQSRLSVTWPELQGYPVTTYELYVDGAASPLAVQTNMKEISQLAPGSLHEFRLAYVLADGRRSGLSEKAVGLTWSEDENLDGLPDDWQRLHFAGLSHEWPVGTADTDGDGASNVQEFLAGTDPLQPSSVLKTSLSTSSQGNFLSWNTRPGQIYQVQTTSDFKSWVNVGGARFAPAGEDMVQVSGSSGVSYYRVIRVR